MTSGGAIKLRRQSTIASCASKFDILVDGKKIGVIGNGEEREFEIGPGHHTVQVAQSQPLNIDLVPDNSAQLECGVTWARPLLIVAIGIPFLLVPWSTFYFKASLAASVTLNITPLILVAWGLFADFKPLKLEAPQYLKRLD